MDVKKENTASQKKLILIVDDEFDLGSTLSMLFELHGFDPLRANNGKQALDLVDQRLPDLVLSDCMMPVMDGIALSKILRTRPATAHIPIILMSATPQQHNLAEARFDAFVHKPFHFKELLGAIHGLMPSAR